MKIFDFWFLTDLHVLKYPNHGFTILTKYLSVCSRVCVWHKFCGRARARTDKRNCTKFYIYLHLNINRCWLDSGSYRSRGSAIVRNFLISLLQRYRTKLRAIILNTIYFKQFILNFETFIYNSNSTINTIFIYLGRIFLTMVILERKFQITQN